MGGKHASRQGPDEIEIRFKPAFEERYAKLTDIDAFRAICGKRLPRSIRVNTLKISTEALIKRLSMDWILRPIPWAPDGFWIEHKDGRRDTGNTLEHQLGYYYIQEAASMIPPLAIAPLLGSTGLDMCAAPGSKTSQLASLMGNSGCIVANDYRGDRLAALGMNLMRCGVLNTVVTLHQGEKFWRNKDTFEWVLCDAPCSGTGTIRKSFKTISIWNAHMVTKLAKQQKILIEAAFQTCKPGGVVVYSTCSLEPEENESVIDHLLKKESKASVETISLPGLKTSPPVLEFEGETYDEHVKGAIRIWPQDNDTEGFFVCRIRKI